MDRKIFGVSGFIGSGKDTVGDYLVEKYNFKKICFADRLKDVTSVLFNYDREMLEGDTKESREQREALDPFWTKKLGFGFTPRKALQMIGTEVIRDSFYKEFWATCVEQMILECDDNIVITDTRFPNEIDMIQSIGGKLVRVVKGDMPYCVEYYQSVCRMLGNYTPQVLTDLNYCPKEKEEILRLHPSEWQWVGVKPDYILDNNGLIEDLYNQIDELMK